MTTIHPALPMLPAQRRHLFALCDRLGFSDDERHELASILIDWPHSWAALTRGQAARLITALEGFVLVQSLIMQRPPLPARRAR